jgi:hypothetical protein
MCMYYVPGDDYSHREHPVIGGQSSPSGPLCCHWRFYGTSRTAAAENGSRNGRRGACVCRNLSRTKPVVVVVVVVNRSDDRPGSKREFEMDG